MHKGPSSTGTSRPRKKVLRPDSDEVEDDDEDIDEDKDDARHRKRRSRI